ncbi:MAG: extracellular solute-binding protein [Clostridia bacterium]|nr:extracellular solute-binding protein [Clostridia bacterium]
MKKLRIVAWLCAVLATLSLFSGCGSQKKILIYTSVEDYVIEDMQACLDEKFPNYDITIEYLSTGEHAAKLLSEKENSDCDIIYDLEYPYLEKLEAGACLANLSEIADKSAFMEELLISDYFLPQCRNGGAVIVNTDELQKKGLSEPTCYEDLLKPEYKGLISMPNPKSSGTGYMFLLSRINALGEEEAFSYFDKLNENIFQYTSSGSGPINALLQGEAVIGLGMTGQAVVKINDEDAPLKVLHFDEGSPYSLYGQAIVKGKEQRAEVKEVFQYLYSEYTVRCCEKFFPERIFADKTFEVENYPQNIQYADMKNNTPEEKERVLGKWKY